METLVLNTIQELIGTEPKPVWTDIDEKAFESLLESVDFKSYNPDISYNEFKDFAYNSILEQVTEDIIVSGFDFQTFEKGGILYYQQGVTGKGIPSLNKDYVDLTGLQYLELVNKITGHDKSRRLERGREEISNLSRSNKPIIRLYKNGRIEYLGGNWNTGAGTGDNFDKENRPGIFKKLTNAGENKAQAIHQMVSEAIIRDNKLLDEYLPKSETVSNFAPTLNTQTNSSNNLAKNCPEGKQQYSEYPNECLSFEEYEKRKSFDKDSQQNETNKNSKENKPKGQSTGTGYSTIKKEFNKLSPVKKMFYQRSYIENNGNNFSKSDYANFHKRIMDYLNKLTDQEVKEKLLKKIGYSDKKLMPTLNSKVKDLKNLSDEDLAKLNIDRKSLNGKNDDDRIQVENVPFMDFTKDNITYRYFPIGNRYIVMDSSNKVIDDPLSRGEYTDEFLEQSLFDGIERKNKITVKKRGGILKFQTGDMIRNLSGKAKEKSKSVESASKVEKPDSNSKKNEKPKVDLDKASLYDVAAAASSLASVVLPSFVGTAADIGSTAFGVMGRMERGESLMSALLDRDTLIDTGATLAGIFPGVGEVAGIGNAIRKLGKVRHLIGPAIAAGGVYMGIKDGQSEKITNSFNKLLDEGWDNLTSEDKSNLAQGINILTSGLALAKNRTAARLPDNSLTNRDAARKGFRAGKSGKGFDVEIKEEIADINPLTGKERKKVKKSVESTELLNDELKTLKSQKELESLFESKFKRKPSEKELTALKAQNIETWRRENEVSMADLGAVKHDILSRASNTLTGGTVGKHNIYEHVLLPNKSFEYDSFVARVNNTPLPNKPNKSSNTKNKESESKNNNPQEESAKSNSNSNNSTKLNSILSKIRETNKKLKNSIKNNSMFRAFYTPKEIENQISIAQDELRKSPVYTITDNQGNTFTIDKNKKTIEINSVNSVQDPFEIRYGNDNQLFEKLKTVLKQYYMLQRGGLIKRSSAIRHILIK